MASTTAFPDLARSLDESSVPPPEADSSLPDRLNIIQRLIVDPLLFVSFLLSLFLVDTHEHNSINHGGARSTSGGETSDSGTASCASRKAKDEKTQWLWQSGRRKRARSEVARALAMRGWMSAVLVISLLVLSIAALGAAQRALMASIGMPRR